MSSAYGGVAGEPRPGAAARVFALLIEQEHGRPVAEYVAAETARRTVAGETPKGGDDRFTRWQVMIDVLSDLGIRTLRGESLHDVRARHGDKSGPPQFVYRNRPDPSSTKVTPPWLEVAVRTGIAAAREGRRPDPPGGMSTLPTSQSERSAVLPRSPLDPDPPEPDPPTPKPVLRARPVEEHHTDTTTYRTPEQERQLERREGPLVKAFSAHLTEKGHRVGAYDISVNGVARPYRVDLYDHETKNVIEAKWESTIEDIRMAVGQLAHYSYLLGSADSPVTTARETILLGSEPSPEIRRFLAELRIGVVWLAGGSLDGQPPAEFAGDDE